MMSSTGILLAAGDWVSLLVFLIPLALWALNQWLSSASTGEERNRREAAARREARGRPPAEPRPGDAPVNDEVGEFLRRAAQRRAEAANTQRPAQRRPAEPARRKPATDRPRRPMIEPPVELVEVEIVEPARPSSLVETVRPQLGSLADSVSAVDREVAAHVKEVFDHQLGRFASPAQPSGLPVPDDGPSPAPPPSPMESILHRLTTPQGMAEAIVLNEILRRPSDNW